MTKYKVIALLLLVTPLTVFAVEFELGFNLDNMNQEGKLIPGGSFFIAESISNHIAVESGIINNKSNNYSAYCSGAFHSSIFNTSVGVLFDIRNSLINPGLIVNGDVKLFKTLSLGGESIFTFSTKNVFDNYLTNLKGFFTVHCKNQDIKFLYEYQHLLLNNEPEGAEIKNKDLSKKIFIDVLAKDDRNPVKIGVFLGTEINQKNYEKSYMDLLIKTGGRIILDFKKFGTYTFYGEAEVFRLGETPAVFPIAVSASAKFNI